jgi:DNA helicase-2/ATP-dependent DNA helicase PcrA
VTAYLRLLLNHSDRVSLERVINRPSRGLGKKGLAAFLGHVDRTGCDPFEAMEKASGLDGVSSRASTELARLASWYRVTSESLLVTGTAAAVVDSLLQNVEILQMYDPGDVTDQARLENIAEFRRSVAEYDAETPEGGLTGFMTEVSLATSVDEYEAPRGSSFTPSSSPDWRRGCSRSCGRATTPHPIWRRKGACFMSA